MLITRVLAWPRADTHDSELNLELRRRVPGELEETSLVLDKREMVWPGAQAGEGRKQDDISWTEAVSELGSNLHNVATNLYHLEILKGEVRNESLTDGRTQSSDWHFGCLPAAGEDLKHTLKPTLIFHP